MLCNALWYATNQHITIEEASQKKKDVHPVPVTFSKYQGYDEYKRKKVKERPMDQSGLFSHAQALYSICSRPIFKSSKEWAAMGDDVKGLADCFESYKVHLEKQLARQEDVHSRDVPMRTVGTNMTVEHRTKAKGLGVLEKYKLIDAAVKDSDE